MGAAAVLRNLKIKRVSLVDMGANFDKSTKDGAHITLFKSAPSVNDVHVPVPPVPKKDEPKTEEPVNPQLKEKTVSKNIIARLLGLVGETDVNKRATEVAEIAKAFGEDDSPVHKADDPMCKCADCMGKRAAKSAPVSDDVNKRFTDLEKQNVDLAKALATEVEKREQGEVREILKSFRATPINMDTDVAKFHKMRKAGPEMFDDIIKRMKATDEMLAQSALFKNIGAGGDNGGGDAWTQIEAKADSLMEKGAADMTREQAIEKVMMDPKNKALVKQYRSQQQ